jgi:hypothetical protein
MKPGTYVLKIEYSASHQVPKQILLLDFPVIGFGGTKSIVISTSSWLGGKNPFLGIAYMTVGSLCVFFGVIFLLKHHFSPRYANDVPCLLIHVMIENWVIIRIYRGISRAKPDKHLRLPPKSVFV